MGVPVAAQKTEGPETTLTFLGIELDSVAMEVSLPRKNLERLRREITGWERKEHCTKQELLSLIRGGSRILKGVSLNYTLAQILL